LLDEGLLTFHLFIGMV